MPASTTHGDRRRSTLPAHNEKAQTGEAMFRRIMTVVMALFVVVSAVGLLGPRERTETAKSAGGVLEVSYPGTIRPGLDSEITLTLEPETPVDSYRIRVPKDVLATLGVESVFPEPSVQVAEGDSVVYVFDAAQRERISFTWAGRVPTQQSPTRLPWSMTWLGHPADPSADATEVSTTAVRLTTWVLP